MTKEWTKREKMWDSYDHYRHRVGCGRLEAWWRAFAYEVLKWPDGIRP